LTRENRSFDDDHGRDLYLRITDDYTPLAYICQVIE